MKNPYYTISNVELTNSPKSKSYQLIQDGDNYIVSFISGELAGREKFVRVTADDFDSLKKEQVTIYEILGKYKTG